MAEILFNCSTLSSQRQNLLKKTVNVTTQRTRAEAWSLVAAVIPADAHGTNSLVPVRFEFGPWPLPHWVQPQVPTAIHLLLTQSFQEAASPSPLPVQNAGLRRTRITPVARLGGHTRAQAQTTPPRELRFLRKSAQNAPLTFFPLAVLPRLLHCWCNVKHKAGKQRRYWLTFLQD